MGKLREYGENMRKLKRNGEDKYWLHRFSSGQALHKLAKTDSASQSSKKGGGLLNPWPGYNFTGRLRPAAQVGLAMSMPLNGSWFLFLQSAKRVVPDHIPRPDYADHSEGYPMSEMKLKGNTYIRSGYQ